MIHVYIKFPFKRNGLPCFEDEPGSEKIALNVLLCMPMKDTQIVFKQAEMH